jgi:hypothetical protein
VSYFHWQFSSADIFWRAWSIKLLALFWRSFGVLLALFWRYFGALVALSWRLLVLPIKMHRFYL